MAGKEGVIIQSVAKAAAILDIFLKKSDIGISEISDLMGMSKSTAFGLVNTLVAAGFLEQDTSTKKYRLGLKLFELGSAFESRMDIRTEARPFCEELTKKYNQTVHLAAHSEGDVIYIDKFDIPDFLIVYSQVGRRAPMNCTGVGKAMLAFLPDEYIKKYVVNSLAAKTRNSCDTPEKLYADLELIRKRGYAVDNEEIQPGLRCVAAPVFSKGGKVAAAVSLSAMANAMPYEDIEKIAADVMLCAGNISRLLGVGGK